MRLFKFLALTIIIGSIYLIARHQYGPVATGYTITTPAGVSIRFPKKPLKKTFNKNLASLGKSRLITYQARTNNQLLVFLSVLPEHKDIQNIKYSELDRIVHEINDTTRLPISNRQHFVQQSYRGVEYRARAENGDSIWCRTVLRGKWLFSLVVIDGNSTLEEQTRNTFLQSLRL